MGMSDVRWTLISGFRTANRGLMIVRAIARTGTFLAARSLIVSPAKKPGADNAPEGRHFLDTKSEAHDKIGAPSTCDDHK